MFLNLEIVSQLLIITLKLSDSARILAIISTPPVAEESIFNPLWFELISRGHHLTLMTPNALKTSQNLTMNLRQIVVDYNFDRNIVFNSFDAYSTFLTEASEKQFEKLQNILEEAFDLLFVDVLNPAMIALGYKLNCPFIGVSESEVTNSLHEAFGNFVSPGVYGDVFFGFDATMGLFERIQNFVHFVTGKVYFKLCLYPKLDDLIKRYLDEDAPKLEEMQKNAKFVFLKLHVLSSVRPVMPNIFRIGKLEKKNCVLPQDIKKFLDDASDSGVIYFNIDSQLAKENKSLFLKAFSNLTQKIIWNSEEDIPNSPKLFVKSRLPQQEILAHPSVKLIVTSGDLKSLEDAIYNAVPVIGVPINNVHARNIESMVKRRIGLRLDFENLDLEKHVVEIVADERIKTRIKEISDLMKSQLFVDLDEMVRWSEFVIKHKYTKLLKHEEIPFYQNLLLDVMLFTILSVSLCLYLQYKCIKVLIVMIKRRRYVRIAKLE